MSLPTTLVLSCGKKDSLDLIKEILGQPDLPPTVKIAEAIEGYPWHIETKYYIADILLCTLKEKNLGSQEFAESVQAVVIYFDSELETSFSKVKEWMAFIEEFGPEVRLLVCDRMSDKNGTGKQDIQQWCLKNNFELVEMNPDTEVDSDTEDDFFETTGIQRIIQALHAHLWPNLEMKDSSNAATASLSRFLQTSDADDSSHQESVTAIENTMAAMSTTDEADKDESKQGADGKSSEEQLFGDMDLSKLMSDGNLEEPESFESLFERFQLMKDKAKNLPFEERKAYAEKVVLAFWQSLGGDEEEIAGLDDKL